MYKTNSITYFIGFQRSKKYIGLTINLYLFLILFCVYLRILVGVVQSLVAYSILDKVFYLIKTL